MKKMKVLHVINSLSAGGAEKLVSDMVPMFNEDKRFEVDVLILSKDNNVFLDNLLNKNTRVYYSKTNKIRSFKNIFFIAKLIRTNNYDIVHSHLFPDFYWSALSSFLVTKNTKFIVTEHNTTNRRRNIPLFFLIEKFIYSRFDAIIAISEETKSELLSWIGLTKKNLLKTHVIYNGIDVKNFEKSIPIHPQNLIKSYKGNDVLLCMVGRFTDQKDQKTLIKSLEYLPPNVKLILVGDGPKRLELIKLTERLKLLDRVSFLGFRHDVNRIYKACDFAIVSSNWEGFGLVAVEGMASRLPTIGSDVAGLSSVIGNKELLFNKNDEQDLARIIQELISSRTKYIKAKEYCVERASEFTLGSMLSSYIDVYVNVIDGGFRCE